MHSYPSVAGTCLLLEELARNRSREDRTIIERSPCAIPSELQSNTRRPALLRNASLIKRRSFSRERRGGGTSDRGSENGTTESGMRSSLEIAAIPRCIINRSTAEERCRGIDKINFLNRTRGGQHAVARARIARDPIARLITQRFLVFSLSRAESLGFRCPRAREHTLRIATINASGKHESRGTSLSIVLLVTIEKYVCTIDICLRERIRRSCNIDMNLQCLYGTCLLHGVGNEQFCTCLL